MGGPDQMLSHPRPLSIDFQPRLFAHSIAHNKAVVPAYGGKERVNYRHDRQSDAR
jgi:hypothetical protein